MAKILTIAQHKGGAGKTTLTTQLAAGLQFHGHKVLLIDADPQGSATEWMQLREKNLGRKNKIDCFQSQSWKLQREVAQKSNDYDFILIDTPPHADSESSVAIRAADLVLIPIQPSPLDLWATGFTLKLALQERVELFLVMNRVPPKSRLNIAMAEKLESMNIRVSKQTMGNRVAYASSIMAGMGVVEYDASGTAAEEIRNLIVEIKKHHTIKQMVQNKVA